MNKIKLLAIISLALAAMVSPMGCLGRKKLQQKSSEATMSPFVAESRVADAGTTEEPVSEVEAIQQTVSVESESPEETMEPSPTEVGSNETEEVTRESVSEETGSFETEPPTEPTSELESPTDPSASTDVPATEPATARPTERPSTAPAEPTTTAPSEGTIAVCSEHDYEYGVLVPPTCTAEGVMTLTCRVCGYVYQGPIEKTGHTWNSGVITTPGTCTAEGIKTYTCTSCKSTRTEAVPRTEHQYAATSTVAQTRIGTMEDLGYTVYTCSGCGDTYKADYEGYLDCAWRYQAVNEFRTSPGRFLLREDGSKVYFNIEGCTQLEPFSRAEGLVNIAMLRAKQEAYDIHNGERLNHEHNGLPAGYYYGTSFWGGLNCECCQYGGNGLDATFREEENAPYASQGHLRIVLNAPLKYIGIAAYVKDGGVVIVCEYSDIPN